LRESRGRLRPRVVVVGGSLGGLNAALWLRNAGCEVDVFERSPAPLEDRGVGIVLHPATLRYFVIHDLPERGQVEAMASWFRYLGTDDQIIYQEPCRYRFTAYHALYTAWVRCLGAKRYHLGRECVGFEQDGQGVTVRFASGEVERCDLLVCADGINSTGRRLLLPEVRPRYAGYVAWRGAIAEEALSPRSLAALHGAIAYAILPDSHALAYPIPAAEGASTSRRRLINWLWYRNVKAGEDLDDLLTTRTGERFGSSVPPGLVQERHLRRLHEEATALPSAFTEILLATDQPFIQVVFDLEVPRMVFGRVCLLGDAAFTARPHAAAGTAKAAENAWALGEAMRASGGDVVEALRTWEPPQLALGKALVERSREAGERLQSGHWKVGEPLAFGLYRSGDSTFDENGVTATRT
jgi:2,6-dihydroxypyridine 3-monooxygenase